MSEGTYLLFVWTPHGYELREPQGDLPEPGAEVEVGEQPLLRISVAADNDEGDLRRLEVALEELL